jgi:phospholipid/cholesterol/gamma-HCH transport system substrate-binding protein
MALSRELKVGTLVLAALAVLATGLLVIGDRNSFFVRKTRYFIRFPTAGGLAPGAAVTLDGVNVGRVDKVVLPTNPEQSEVDVWLEINRSYGDRLRAPETRARPLPEVPPATQARLQTLGLLGDKFIELNSGSVKYPAIPDEGEIPAAAQANLEHLMASGEDVMSNVTQISHSLQDILARMNRGEGLLGQLTTDSAPGRQLRESLIGTMQSLQRVAEKMENGSGALPRLINDRQLADRLAGAVERLDAVLASAQKGPGILPALLNDPAERAKMDETLANLNGASKDLKQLTARMGSGQALLPRLVSDEAYGREITRKLREIVDHLDTVSDRLVEGKGTAARLINDPSVYEAINDVIVGMNQSKMLRWLIQNRQKAGIKKRYEETTGGGSGQSPAYSTAPAAPPRQPQQPPPPGGPPPAAEAPGPPPADGPPL